MKKKNEERKTNVKPMLHKCNCGYEKLRKQMRLKIEDEDEDEAKEKEENKNVLWVF